MGKEEYKQISTSWRDCEAYLRIEHRDSTTRGIKAGRNYRLVAFAKNRLSGCIISISKAKSQIEMSGVIYKLVWVTSRPPKEQNKGHKLIFLQRTGAVCLARHP